MKIFIIILIFASTVFPQRIKDLTFIKGDEKKQIIGYGLVVGLAGTGDSPRSSFTIQSISSMLKRFGITVPQTDLRIKNTAAVMVTATLSKFLKQGSSFDVEVSSLGDATSLLGGTLLLTPISSVEGNFTAFAQGPLSVGGYDINTSTGSRVAKNHSLAGRIPNGGIIKEQSWEPISTSQEITLYLNSPDAATVSNIVTAINTKYGENTCSAVDEAEVKIKIPEANKSENIKFIADIQAITIQTDNIARVVLNERTGTVVAGSNVIIKPVTISQGGLNLTIRNYPIVSQPGAFSNGTTAVINNQIPSVTQDSANSVVINGATNVQEIARALNSLKVSPKDIISIFQALKEAGALIAELKII